MAKISKDQLVDGIRWESNYTTVNSNSSLWESNYTTYNSNSSNYVLTNSDEFLSSDFNNYNEILSADPSDFPTDYLIYYDNVFDTFRAISNANLFKNIPDSVFRIVEDTDINKALAFDISNITSATTRTLTIPDQNLDLTPDSGNFSSSSHSSRHLSGGSDQLDGDKLFINYTPTNYESTTSTLSGHFDGINSCLLETGDIVTSIRTTKTGYLLLDGSSISKTVGGGGDYFGTEYEDLFELVKACSPNTGTEDWNSDDTVTLLDLRGRVLAGKDNMGGTTASRITSAGSGVDGTVLGGSGGFEEITLTEAQMPSHTHTENYWSGETQRGNSGVAAARNSLQSQPTGSAGGDEAHENMPPFTIVNIFIKI